MYIAVDVVDMEAEGDPIDHTRVSASWHWCTMAQEEVNGMFDGAVWKSIFILDEFSLEGFNTYVL